MYTHCPACKTCYRLLARHLAGGHGEVYCSRCSQIFDALDHLSDEAQAGAVNTDLSASRIPVLGVEDTVSGIITGQRPPVAKPASSPVDIAPPVEHWSSSLGWMTANLLLVLALVLQSGFILIQHQANEESSRPWLEKICHYAHCRLPPFHDPSALQILARQLRPIAGDKPGYDFLLVIANQASLPQALPRIRLTFMDKSGHPTAQRIFSPREYLPPPMNNALMPLGKAYEIRLQLSRTVRDVGGFTFVLI